jgi:hypothetical protein
MACLRAITHWLCRQTGSRVIPEVTFPFYFISVYFLFAVACSCCSFVVVSTVEAVYRRMREVRQKARYEAVISQNYNTNMCWHSSVSEVTATCRLTGVQCRRGQQFPLFRHFHTSPDWDPLRFPSNGDRQIIPLPRDEIYVARSSNYILLTVYKITKLKKRPRSNKGLQINRQIKLSLRLIN